MRMKMRRCIAYVMLVICAMWTLGTVKTRAEQTDASTPAEVTVVEETGPTISLERTRLELGKKLKLTVSGNEGKVTWMSMNPEVATVTSKGKVTGVGVGTTRIFATVDGKKLKCIVRVVEVNRISIIAVGDNLYHEKVIQSGLRSDGSYNYDEIYANISGYIQKADIRIINQEVLLTNNSSLWAGYPCFASPTEVGDAVVKAGFNVIACATNHSMDKQVSGAEEAIKYWKSQAKNGVIMVGMYDCLEDYNNIMVEEYNGVKVAFLNYTYGLNGIKLPSDKSYLVKLTNESLIKKEIKEAKKLADVIIVLPHWGTEYEFSATDTQRELAQKMAEWGADLIIGTHPHVLEPLEIITTSKGKEVPCYYSLGNFVSNYTNYDRQLEGMAEVTIAVCNGKVTIEKSKITPIVNHAYINSKGVYKYSVYLLKDYTDSLAKAHYSRRLYSDFSVSYLKNQFKSITE